MSRVALLDVNVLVALFDSEHGHRQLTDVYLLGLATRMRGCLATFDRSIPVKAVVGATSASLQVIEALSSVEP